MRILLTGGTGLIGSFLAKSFASEGHEVTIFHRRAHLPKDLQEFSSHICELKADLFDLTTVTEALQNCDVVIHLAGLVSFAPRDKRKMHRINIEATRLWVDAALSSNINHFIYFSSVSALGHPKSLTLIDETAKWEDQPNLTEYGRTKHMGEREVWRGIEEGLPGVIINPSVVIGPGSEIRSSFKMLQYVKNKGKFIFPGIVNYIDIRDVYLLLQILLQENIVGKQYIVSAGSLNYAELLQKMAAKIGVKPPNWHLPLPLLQAIAPLEEARNRVFGSDPLITRDMIKSLRKSVTYNGQKATSLPGFAYRDLDDSLRWVVNEMWGTNMGKV
ncbi:MAG: NAD-dependent epimerase/dehydratase family protein [Bacteroidota bacterium]